MAGSSDGGVVSAVVAFASCVCVCVDIASNVPVEEHTAQHSTHSTLPDTERGTSRHKQTDRQPRLPPSMHAGSFPPSLCVCPVASLAEFSFYRHQQQQQHQEPPSSFLVVCIRTAPFSSLSVCLSVCQSV